MLRLTVQLRSPTLKNKISILLHNVSVFETQYNKIEKILKA